MTNKKWEYFLNEDYSFSISIDDVGRKTGVLKDLRNNEILADNLIQKVIPEKLPNLLNAAKVVISAAWQDGKILPEEREAFEAAFANVDFTDEQRTELEKEFENPSPIEELIEGIESRDHKMFILETCILLVVADGEFHPKEKEFIDKLVKKFGLAPTDFAILYRILPERAKKYIVKEKLHESLDIKADEIEMIKKYAPVVKIEDLKNAKVYKNMLSNWKNRRTRYSRIKSY